MNSSNLSKVLFEYLKEVRAIRKGLYSAILADDLEEEMKIERKMFDFEVDFQHLCESLQ